MGKRQTRDWKWTIEVTNSHTQPVAVRVEDSEPQIGDSAIEVKVDTDAVCGGKERGKRSHDHLHLSGQCA